MHSIIALGTQGIKSSRGGSTAFLLNAHHTIDAGNIVIPLGEKSASIHHIWLTHAHLDHIVDIAYMIDSYHAYRTETLTIHAQPETIQVLQEHFFNNKIWPDFSKIPLLDHTDMSLTYAPISLHIPYPIGEESTIQAFASDHTVACCGYMVTKKNRSLLISSDTHSLTSVVSMIEQHPHIHAVVIECSFPSKMHTLAALSKHLTPALLFSELDTIKERNLKLYINHIKPTYHREITEELSLINEGWNPTVLKDGDTILF